MKTKYILAALGACVIAAFVVLALKKSPKTSASAAKADPPAIPAQAASQPNDKTPVLYFAKNADPAPAFTAKDLAGNTISIDNLRGKVVLLNFWATWCGPCNEEIPELISLQSRYQGKLQIIGVSEDEAPPSQVAKFAQRKNLNYPVIAGDFSIERAYGGVVALPTSFLINTKGQVVQKDVGLYPSEYYEMQVRALLGMPVDARIETFQDTGQIFLKNAAKAGELPGVDFSGLTPEQKKVALHRMNAENCNCGCRLTIAECRINDTTCPISTGLAKKIVQAVAHGNSDAANPSRSSGTP